MKKLTLSLLILLLSSACASPIPLKPFSERWYRPCTEKDIPDYVGKYCYRYCAKTNWLDYCSKYEYIVEDMKDPAVHNKFIAAGFLLKSFIE
jgi:hypothetical protein